MIVTSNIDIVKMEINVVLNACHNNYYQVSTINCENKMYVIKMEINVLSGCHNY